MMDTLVFLCFYCCIPLLIIFLVLWAMGVLFPPPKPGAEQASDAELAKATMLALPDVLGVSRRDQVDTIIEVTISGEQYNDAQMDRLLEAESRFQHPGCRLSFRYIPAAYAAQKESPDDPRC